MKYNLFIIIIAFFFSCKKGNDIGIVSNTQNHILTNKCELIFNKIKEIELDSTTLNILGYLQFLDSSSIQYLTFLNQYDNSIYIYDYESSKFIRKIIFKNEKLKSVKIQGYNYINDDSIFIYSYSRHRIYLTNTNSDLLFDTLMYDRSKVNKENLLPAPYFHTPSPLKLFQEKIITVGFIAGEYDSTLETNRSIITLLNLKNNSLSHAVKYPEQYIKYNWGGGLTYRMPYYDLNKNSILISFSAHHSLIKYDLLTNKEKEYYAGSKFIKEIRSYPTPKKEQSPSESEWNWYINTPSYEGVFYDKYRDLYYRIARLPIEPGNNDEKYNRKPVSVIILDSSLNYIGESKLPSNIIFSPFNSFVTVDGFNIQAYTEDEDKLTFYQYKIKHNEN